MHVIQYNVHKFTQNMEKNAGNQTETAKKNIAASK